MNLEHTVKQFDADLEGLRTRVLAMGGLVEQQVIFAMDGLESGDMALIERVIANDRQVNRHEVELDEACERIGEDQDLAGIGWVGQRLDVAGHAGVEDDLARHRRLCSIPLAPEQGAVLEGEGHRLRHGGGRSRHERQSRSNFVS